MLFRDICLIYDGNSSADFWEFTINIYLIRCGESYVDIVGGYHIKIVAQAVN